jgi:hypothetical protein
MILCISDLSFLFSVTINFSITVTEILINNGQGKANKDVNAISMLYQVCHFLPSGFEKCFPRASAI